jgi:hypothetical protein
MPVINALAIVDNALSLLSGHAIPYRLGGRTRQGGMDCQGAIAYCVEKAGGKAPWRDSNELARKYLDGEIIPIAKAKGNLKGYAGLMIDPVSAGTPLRYRADAFALQHGDCTHAGLITQAGDVWSVDASKTAGRVRGRTEREARNCWTHAARLKGVDYDLIKKPLPAAPNTTAPIPSIDEHEQPVIEAGVSGGMVDRVESVEPQSVSAQPWYRAIVSTPNGGTVKLRNQPSASGTVWHATPACGETVIVTDSRGEWSKAQYKHLTGWIQTQYLQPVEG